MFIHESPNWPKFRWNTAAIAESERKVIHSLGFLAGRMASIGFDDRLKATVEAITNDVVASSEIEGVKLNTDEVRSSLARKFGVTLPKEKDPTHYIEGIVDMMLDATQNIKKPLTEERLFGWHCALFPMGSSGGVPITVGAYRSEKMSVVSGAIGHEKVHYRAPEPERVPKEMERFLKWLNGPNTKPSVTASAIAHLWFVCIHPFDDGNGRIARAISDMILAKFDNTQLRFYSLSRQIFKDRKHYYDILERTSRGDGEVTEWLAWYHNAVIKAIDDSNTMLSDVLRKATFWNAFVQKDISERQRKILNIYLDGYDAKLTAKNWQKLAKVSKDTALRDIASLEKQGILTATPGRVRDVAYSINYTAEASVLQHLTDIAIVRKNDFTYITATYKGSQPLSDRILEADLQRFENQEITLQDLALKYFAYLA